MEYIETDCQNLSDVLKKVQTVEDAAQTIKPTTITEIALKLAEECGEVAQDVLKLSGYKASKDAKEFVTANLKEEIVDVMMVAMILSNRLGMTEKELAAGFDKKIAKWKRKHIKKRPDDK